LTHAFFNSSLSNAEEFTFQGFIQEKSPKANFQREERRKETKDKS
jgi:hypothetical protein